VIIRIGMRCGYEGCWAQPLAIGSLLQGDGYSRRGAAPTWAVAFAGLVWEPRLGAKLLGMGSVLLGGRHSLRGAAPTRGVLFCGLVWEPRLGAKLWGCARDCGIAAIVRGEARLLQGRCNWGMRNRVGGGVAPAVLPHHRTYGSVYGGSCLLTNSISELGVAADRKLTQ